MGRLIDIDEIKKRYPIMENDFGMVVNESLHEELDKIPSVEAISKADMMTILDKIRAEIEFEVDHRTNMLCAEDVFVIIDKYKEGVENEE